MFEKAHKIHNVWPEGFYLMMPFLPPQPEIRVKFLTHDRTAAAAEAASEASTKSASYHISTINSSIHQSIHPFIHMWHNVYINI